MKNPSAHLTEKISANRDLESMPPLQCEQARVHSCVAKTVQFQKCSRAVLLQSKKCYILSASKSHVQYILCKVSGHKPPGQKPLFSILFINGPLLKKSRFLKQLSRILPIFSCFGILNVIFWISE